MIVEHNKIIINGVRYELTKEGHSWNCAGIIRDSISEIVKAVRETQQDSPGDGCNGGEL